MAAPKPQVKLIARQAVADAINAWIGSLTSVELADELVLLANKFDVELDPFAVRLLVAASNRLRV